MKTLIENCKNNITIYAIDPSGNKNGTTGICLLNFNSTDFTINKIQTYNILESDFNSKIDYENRIIEIGQKYADIVIIENYINYAERSKAYTYQENSTSELIRVIERVFQQKDIPIDRITAVSYKKLVDKQFLQKNNICTKKKTQHEKDALSMALYRMFYIKREYYMQQKNPD